MNVFDMHVHVFPDKIARKAVENLGNYYHVQMQDKGTYESLRESLNNAKDIKKCLIHATATTPHQTNSVNRFIASYIGENMPGFGSVHPDSEFVDEEIDNIMSLGLKGIKLHPDFQGFDTDDKKAFKIYEHAEGKLPILFHAGDVVSEHSSPKKIRNVHDNFPNLKIIAAHLGGYSRWEEAEEYLVGTDVWFDTSSTLQSLPPERAESIIRKHGIEKCMFGTDFPMHNQKYVLNKFLQLNFSDNEFEDLLWNNAHRFLGLSK